MTEASPVRAAEGPVASRGGLTLGLLAFAALAGSLLALGVGRPPGGPNAAIEQIREESRFPGRALFTEHKCVVCHGADGGGAEMGPGLGAVMAEYLSASGGDREAALARLVEYMRDPKGVPTLRRDTTRYPNPMPSAQGLGLDDEKLRRIAEYILNMKPTATAVGGDASGR